MRASTKLRPINHPESFRTSFVPSSIQLLNELMDRQLNILHLPRRLFKVAIYTKPKPNPIYFQEYTRWTCVNIARIRCKNSNLKADLFVRSLIDSPNCDFCDVPENAEHFFEQCKKFERLRYDFTKCIPIECVNQTTLQHGSNRYDKDLNVKIQLAAQAYIMGSNRFV